MPKSRVEFWQKKFETNVKRDQEVQKELYNQGIKCLIIWECTIKKMKKDYDLYEKNMNIVAAFLKNKEYSFEF